MCWFIFLLLLTLTSFRSVARRLSRANWRRLHKTGVYVIWLVATAIYFRSVGSGICLHRVAFAALLAAWNAAGCRLGEKAFQPDPRGDSNIGDSAALRIRGAGATRGSDRQRCVRRRQRPE